MGDLLSVNWVNLFLWNSYQDKGYSQSRLGDRLIDFFIATLQWQAGEMLQRIFVNTLIWRHLSP